MLLARFGRDVRAFPKGVDSVVTEFDAEAERLIAARIRSRYPDHAIIGEEESPGAALGERAWAVDPIDGTRNYAAGVPLWAVSVAALEDGEPVAGAIHLPVTGELFGAARGHGAWLERGSAVVDSGASGGMPPASGDSGVRETLTTAPAIAPPTGGGSRVRETLLVGGAAELAQAVAITDWHPPPGGGEREAERRGRLAARFRRTRAFGSVACSLCYVAAGRFDLYHAAGVSLWDVAAGVLLVREAGGEVRALDGGPWRADAGGVLAGNAALLSRFLRERASPEAVP